MGGGGIGFGFIFGVALVCGVKTKTKIDPWSSHPLVRTGLRRFRHEQPFLGLLEVREWLDGIVDGAVAEGRCFGEQ